MDTIKPVLLRNPNRSFWYLLVGSEFLIGGLIFAYNAPASRFLIADIVIPHYAIGGTLMIASLVALLRRPSFGSLFPYLLPMFFLFIHQATLALLEPARQKWPIVVYLSYIIGSWISILHSRYYGTSTAP